MKNGWTSGQYGVYRGIFGIYLFIHFMCLVPWSGELFSNEGMIPEGSMSFLLSIFPNVFSLNDSVLFTQGLTLAGALASLFFMLGKWDRVAAFFLWYLLTCLYGRNPLISNPSLPFVGWLLIAHLFIPKAPFGCWRMPSSIFLSAWIVMSCAYTYSGVIKFQSPSWVDGSALSYLLQNPLIRCNAIRDFLLAAPPLLLKVMTWSILGLEAGFVLFALVKMLRPWAWLTMLLMHLGILSLVNFADLTWGMIIVHLFTFDPGWIKPRPMQGRLVVFYDGACGLCHSFVRFVLGENKNGLPFLFKPLDDGASATSIVVEDQGKTLLKSDAVFRVMMSLGGLWKPLAYLFLSVPKKLRDFVYDIFASIRRQIFAKPKEACPIVPQEMRKFFYD